MFQRLRTEQPINTLGAVVDSLSAGLGNVLLNGPVLTAMIVATFVVCIWRLWRARAFDSKIVMKMVGVPIIMVALLALTTNGAMKSTGGTNGPFKPGTFSPGWVMVIANNILDAVANEPLKTMNNQTIPGLNTDPGSDAANQKGACTTYVHELHKKVSDESATAAHVSQLWENVGLPFYFR